MTHLTFTRPWQPATRAHLTTAGGWMRVGIQETYFMTTNYREHWWCDVISWCNWSPKTPCCRSNFLLSSDKWVLTSWWNYSIIVSPLITICTPDQNLKTVEKVTRIHISPYKVRTRLCIDLPFSPPSQWGEKRKQSKTNKGGKLLHLGSTKIWSNYQENVFLPVEVCCPVWRSSRPHTE